MKDNIMAKLRNQLPDIDTLKALLYLDEITGTLMNKHNYYKPIISRKNIKIGDKFYSYRHIVYSIYKGECYNGELFFVDGNPNNTKLSNMSVRYVDRGFNGQSTKEIMYGMLGKTLEEGESKEIEYTVITAEEGFRLMDEQDAANGVDWHGNKLRVLTEEQQQRKKDFDDEVARRYANTGKNGQEYQPIEVTETKPAFNIIPEEFLYSDPVDEEQIRLRKLLDEQERAESEQ
jgi:hypothetical protein